MRREVPLHLVAQQATAYRMLHFPLDRVPGLFYHRLRDRPWQRGREEVKRVAKKKAKKRK